MIGLDPMYVRLMAKEALAEDVGSGDITTLLTVPQEATASAAIIAREDMVVAGLPIARAVFKMLDKNARLSDTLCDGDRAAAGQHIASVIGAARALLTGERVALNFLQRMSGIATMTARYVDLVAGTKARIVDTRKTTPGLRRLEKYAVTVGGGHNHRFGLSDGVLIKDNHIATAGGVTAAVLAAKKNAPHTLKIEVEVETLSQLEEATTAGADAVLLDNMSIETLRQAVEVAADLVLLEASGGVNEENVREIAETGVDLISVGALTHSAPAVDISMEITPGQ
jgi:nicotinate-nucleotide pyrophosphorylase (carboxylating)